MKEKIPDLPVITTTDVTAISYTIATSGGTVTSEGGAPIITRGVCWNTTGDPTIDDNKTFETRELEIFTSSLTKLSGNTTYFVRAYATNNEGIGYGNSVSFTTKKFGEVTDIDDNVYKTVTIGTQTWMGENLKTARYRNGDLIATTNPAELDILNTPQPRFQWAYEGSNSNVNIYGRLYTAFVVNDSRYLCPTGWHVPTDDEWKTLEMFLGMSQSDADKSRDELGTYLILRGKTEGAKLKEAGYQHWLEDASWLSADMRATNETGFTALPGGFRRPNSSEGAAFQNIDEQGTWWSSTVLPNNEYNWVRILYDNGGQILRDKFFMNYGFSVRCIKDN